jgi:uncharacterized protein YqgC (DUF456 family)
MEPQIYFVVAAILVVLGLAGTIVPVLPGILLVFGGLFLAAWADGFQHVGAVGLSIIGALGVASLGFDFVASLLGAKRVGASPLALAGAAIGGIVGVFLGIAGVILGPFIGAVAGEYLARGRLAQAGKVGFGTWIGLLLAAVAKVVVAFLMIGTFAAFCLFG